MRISDWSSDVCSSDLFVDRFLHTSMQYPLNYGFIPHTLANDGDPVDVLIANNIPVIPGAVVRVRPIGMLVMEDEAGVVAAAVHPAGEHDIGAGVGGAQVAAVVCLKHPSSVADVPWVAAVDRKSTRLNSSH